MSETQRRERGAVKANILDYLDSFPDATVAEVVNGTGENVWSVRSQMYRLRREPASPRLSEIPRDEFFGTMRETFVERHQR